LPQYTSPLPQYDLSLSLEADPGRPQSAPSAHATAVNPPPPRDASSRRQTCFRLLTQFPESIERWQPGEEPTIVVPGASVPIRI
jgi:hypothetical protein